MKRILVASAAVSLFTAAPVLACQGKDTQQAKAAAKGASASKDKKGEETPVKKG